MSMSFDVSITTTPETEAWWRQALEAIYRLEDGTELLDSDEPVLIPHDIAVTYHGLRGLEGNQELAGDEGQSLLSCGVVHEFRDGELTLRSDHELELSDDDLGLHLVTKLLVQYHEAHDPQGGTAVDWIEREFHENRFIYDAGVVVVTARGVSNYPLYELSEIVLQRELAVQRKAKP